MATAPRPPGPPPAGRAGSLLHGVGGRRPVVLLGAGAVAVVVVIALARRRSAAAPGTTGAAGGTAAAGTYDSSLNDVYNQLEDQILALQDQITALTPTPATAASGARPVLYGGAPPVGSVPVPVTRLGIPAPTGTPGAGAPLLATLGRARSTTRAARIDPLTQVPR